MNSVRKALLHSFILLNLFGQTALADPVPAIPPSETSTPAQPDSSKAPSQANPTPQLPSDVILAPDQTILSYLIQKGFFASFPDNLFYPEKPISRGDFIALLYRASGIKNAFVSEFPYFQDVPLNHWAYFPIESFRVRQMIQGNDNGFFYPDQAVTRQDAAYILSKTLPEEWLRLSSEEVNATLSVYALPLEPIPPWARYDVSRSVFAGFLLPTYHAHQDQLTLDLDAPLTRMDAARMVYRRALIEEEGNRPLSASTPWLPAGIKMTISPTTAISPEGLEVGQTLYFSLSEPWEAPQHNLAFPRGVRIHGKLTEVSSDKLQGIVTLDKANLPSGESYNLSAVVFLQFKPDKKENQLSIVPGQTYVIETRPPNPQ